MFTPRNAQLQATKVPVAGVCMDCDEALLFAGCRPVNSNHKADIVFVTVQDLYLAGIVSAILNRLSLFIVT